MTTDSEEEWRPVIGYEEWYEVSNLGRVRSWKRRGGRTVARGAREVEPRILGGAKPSRDGYIYVALSLNGNTRRHFVHRLVAFAFIGEPAPGLDDCCHGDGNPQNNRLENLRWDSRAGNMADTRLHGTRLEGSRVASSVLTEELVIAIDATLRRGEMPQADIAAQFGVSTACIGHINTGKTWASVTGRSNTCRPGVGKGGLRSRTRARRVKA